MSHWSIGKSTKGFGHMPTPLLTFSPSNIRIIQYFLRHIYTIVLLVTFALLYYLIPHVSFCVARPFFWHYYFHFSPLKTVFIKQPFIWLIKIYIYILYYGLFSKWLSKVCGTKKTNKIVKICSCCFNSYCYFLFSSIFI